MPRHFRPDAGAALSTALVVAGCELVSGLVGDRALGPLSGDSDSGVDGAGGNAGSAGNAGSGAGGSGAADASAGADSGPGGAAGSGGSAGSGGASSGGTSGSASEGGPGGSGGSLVAGPSCKDMNGTECAGESCCTALTVPGGSFPMGRSKTGDDHYDFGPGNELPEHVVTVSRFVLDKYEVTVGRFRRFVEAFDGKPPAPNAGAHPQVPDSGWRQEWSNGWPVDREALRPRIKCDEPDDFDLWTERVGQNENYPMNCADWFVAYAFCIWDGGRLPTEAEWEFAAAGGQQNRLFPWKIGEAPDDEHAAFDCQAGGSPSVCALNDLPPVGSRPEGNGLYGHADLAGSIQEMTRDTFDATFYGSAAATVQNPLNLDVSGAQYPSRGGNFYSTAADLRAANRNNPNRSSRWNGIGMRCARDP